jgi:large subunit ribosomal protein L28
MAALSTRLTCASTSSLAASFRGLSLNTTNPLIKRGFSTSTCLQKKKTLPEEVPNYPYKPNYVYKQADSGLYAGVSISYGNKISKGRNKGKTRRSWKPNVRWKKMHSDALEKDIMIKLTRKALRTIEKCGGLDQYVLSDKPSRIKELGLTGWQLRYQIMQTPKLQEKFAKMRKALGLEEPPRTFEEWLDLQGLGDKKLKPTAQKKPVTRIQEVEKPSNEGSLPPSPNKSESENNNKGSEKEKEEINQQQAPELA